ncbi:MAG: 16S rRNA (uracil(1498)-N(3))-methyltransferase [Velocimicrobium sp.]
MHCFYIDRGQIEGELIHIVGDDVNHIKNVLRMNVGEKLLLCDKEGQFYTCTINKIDGFNIETKIISTKRAETELSSKIYLFQGLPKKDKMELIIQKAVELGVYEVIPVATKYCVVKIEDPKKEIRKLERWQSISEAAAKQSGRGIIPRVHEIMNFHDAIGMAKNLGGCIIPYEQSEGMTASKDAIDRVCKEGTIGVFIGPEGGFSNEEISCALESFIQPISLGKRILRTETAGLTTLSLLMFEVERNGEE